MCSRCDEEILPRRVPHCRAVVSKLGRPKPAALRWVREGDKMTGTHSESATAGITPSITFSSFGSLPETSQTIILPSAPHVV